MLSTGVRNAARVGSRHPMSTAAAPKIHKYKDAGPELMKTRPPPGHEHVSREHCCPNVRRLAVAACADVRCEKNCHKSNLIFISIGGREGGRGRGAAGGKFPPLL